MISKNNHVLVKSLYSSDNGAKLFLFPHSGSGPEWYLQWGKMLPKLQVYAVHYPSRGRRLSIPANPNIEHLAAEIAELINQETQTGPYFFFGHSFGALVAFEVAQRLQNCQYPMPQCLFVSSLAGPKSNYQQIVKQDVTAEDLYAMAAVFSTEIAEALRDDQELQEIFLKPLKNDLMMIHQYKYTHTSLLQVPIHAFGGSDDELHKDHLTLWETETHHTFSIDIFSGGHFYYLDDFDTFISYFKQRINQYQQL